jgi:hypothetical protein
MSQVSIGFDAKMIHDLIQLAFNLVEAFEGLFCTLDLGGVPRPNWRAFSSATSSSTFSASHPQPGEISPVTPVRSMEQQRWRNVNTVDNLPKPEHN